jgi:hypothetical protein
MSKVVVRVGHRELVVPPAAALAVIDAISGAEVYEAKWHRGEGGGIRTTPTTSTRSHSPTRCHSK